MIVYLIIAPNPITRVFGEFIKGITYFAYHELNILTEPVYHRLNSCGPGDNSFRETYQQCNKDMDKVRRNEIKLKIETCYIERLIYNQTLFFSNSTGTDDHSQDKGHIYRLNITKEDFRTCFPNLTIEIDLKYDLWWPIEITISRYIRGKLVSTEKYHKDIIIDNNGTRRYANYVKADTYKYTKIQHFDYPSKWLRLE